MKFSKIYLTKKYSIKYWCLWDENRIFDTCKRLFREGKLSGEPIVDPVVPFEDLVTEYPKIMSDPGSNIKLGCSF